MENPEPGSCPEQADANTAAEDEWILESFHATNLSSAHPVASLVLSGACCRSMSQLQCSSAGLESDDSLETIL